MNSTTPSRVPLCTDELLVVYACRALAHLQFCQGCGLSSLLSVSFSCRGIFVCVQLAHGFLEFIALVLGGETGPTPPGSGGGGIFSCQRDMFSYWIFFSAHGKLHKCPDVFSQFTIGGSTTVNELYSISEDPSTSEMFHKRDFVVILLLLFKRDMLQNKKKSELHDWYLSKTILPPTIFTIMMT